LTVEQTGFKKAVLQNVLVHIGETTRADIPLQIGDVSQNVEVLGEAALIAPDTVAATTVLTSREYDNLPLAAVSRVRIPTDFALLTPGVIGSQQRPGDTQSATTNLSLDGSSSGATDILVEGMAAGQIQNFGSFTEMAVPVDSVAEFNIMKGIFPAEYGHVRTGLVSFSLKSGGNNTPA
jgi:hypothetical protein